MLWAANKNVLSQDFDRNKIERAFQKLEMVVVDDLCSAAQPGCCQQCAAHCLLPAHRRDPYRASQGRTSGPDRLGGGHGRRPTAGGVAFLSPEDERVLLDVVLKPSVYERTKEHRGDNPC
jgi:hypothetical protein